MEDQDGDREETETHTEYWKGMESYQHDKATVRRGWKTFVA